MSDNKFSCGYEYYEFVNATIIGDMLFPYQFWTRDGNKKIAEKHFRCDEDAVEWFKCEHPEQFKIGAEMRTFDKV